MTSEDQDLRHRLQAHLGPSADIPPITDSTRKILWDKLKSLEQHKPGSTNPTPTKTTTHHHMNHKKTEEPPTATTLPHNVNNRPNVNKPSANKDGTISTATNRTTTDTPTHHNKTEQLPQHVNTRPYVNMRPTTNRPSADRDGKISTLVFLDLEATGLPSKINRARITELSLVAVDLDQFDRLHRDLVSWREQCQQQHQQQQGQQFRFSPVESVSPRVTNKLTLCLQPCAKVPFNVSDITGLDNHNLQDQKRFTLHTSRLLRDFLDHLTPPICIVAHNAARYDLPLLKAEMASAGTGDTGTGLTGIGHTGIGHTGTGHTGTGHTGTGHTGTGAGHTGTGHTGTGHTGTGNTGTGHSGTGHTGIGTGTGHTGTGHTGHTGTSDSPLELRPDLFFVDSLEAFRHIFRQEKEGVEKEEMDVAQELSMLGHFDDAMDFEDNDDVIGYREQIESTQTPSANCSPVNQQHNNIKQPKLDPKIPPINDEDRDRREENESTPDKQSIPTLSQPPQPRPKNSFVPSRDKKVIKAKKRLDFSQPPSFSLPKLHEHLFGRQPLVTHGAEQDCLSLLRVCALKRAGFLNYARENARSVSTVAKMW